jgi:hypothetical protein
MSEYNPETAGMDENPDLAGRLDRPLTGEAATLPPAAPQEGAVDTGADSGSSDPAVEGGTRAP